eukprot:IDg4296t1
MVHLRLNSNFHVDRNANTEHHLLLKLASRSMLRLFTDRVQLISKTSFILQLFCGMTTSSSILPNRQPSNPRALNIVSTSLTFCESARGSCGPATASREANAHSPVRAPRARKARVSNGTHPHLSGHHLQKCFTVLILPFASHARSQVESRILALSAYIYCAAKQIGSQSDHDGLVNLFLLLLSSAVKQSLLRNFLQPTREAPSE